MGRKGPEKPDDAGDKTVSFEKARLNKATLRVVAAARASNAMALNPDDPDSWAAFDEEIPRRFGPTPVIDIDNPNRHITERRSATLEELIELLDSLWDLNSPDEKKRLLKEEKARKRRIEDATLRLVEDLGDRMQIRTDGFVIIDYAKKLDLNCDAGLPDEGTTTLYAYKAERDFDIGMVGKGTIENPYSGCLGIFAWARVNWLRSKKQRRPVVFSFNYILAEVNASKKTLSVVGKSKRLGGEMQPISGLNRSDKVYIANNLLRMKAGVEGELG